MKRLLPMLLLIVIAVTTGCSKSKDSSTTTVAGLSNADFNSLQPEAQYATANKLMATLFQGVAAKDFFDLSSPAGVSTLRVSGGQDFISKTQTALATPLPDRQTYIDLVDQKYEFDEEYQPMQYPLAMLYEFPLSKDYFDVWMAYTLASTILFSPAEELDSVDLSDIQKVLYRLTMMIREDQPIREIVYEHTTSQENWRRFRSPEDNTREMMEVYLARFRDDEVPKEAKICRNWHLSSGDEGYQLIIGYNENDEPQNVLDTTVTSCFDFYRAVADHASLMPRITSILVSRLLPNASAADSASLINDIVGSNPTTFRQLFLSLLFSRQYLLNTDRTKYFEETFFNLAHRLQWTPNNYFFYNLNPHWGSGIPTLNQMRQQSFSYKLGRKEVPVDSLSFAYYHKAVREQLLINRKTYEGDSGWPEGLYNSITLTGNDFVQYLFLNTLSRKATADELATLNAVFTSKHYDPTTNKREMAMFTLDYCSRLAELYAFRSVQ